MTIAIEITNEDPLLRFMHRVAKGDQLAFEQLYQHTAPRMYAIALRILRRRDWADDVLQEAYVRIWHGAADYFSERGSVMGWMATILRYRAIDRLRREKKHGLADRDVFELEIEEEGSDPQRIIACRKNASLLDNCMSGLREEQRQCIELAFFDGFTHEQLSERLAAPLGTVKSWVRRGLQALRRCMES
jgi:RNA polymerase sigma-70 factor (ECF subfamily)